MRNKFFFLVFLIVSLLLFVSCDQRLKKSVDGGSAVKTVEQKDNNQQPDEIKPDESEEVKFRIVNLYFVNADTGELAVEKRQVFDLKEETSMIKQVLRSLKLGPVSNLKPSVPQNIEFKDVFVYKGIVYIDLHKTDDDSFIGGVEGEKLFLEAVVKTALGLSPNYKEVCFLVDGEETDSILGHLDCSNPFSEKSFE